MKIIRKQSCVLCIIYRLWFRYVDQPEHGYSFPCDAQGEVLVDQMTEVVAQSYLRCVDGTYNVECVGILPISASQVLDAIGFCDVCGDEVMLSSAVNTCASCGSTYSRSGHRTERGYFVMDTRGDDDITEPCAPPATAAVDGLFDYGGDDYVSMEMSS